MISLPTSCGAVGWDKKDVILKNKPEKLLKTNGKATWIAKNKPENKAEMLLKTRTCGKNKPETKRKTKRAILLKIKESKKNDSNVVSSIRGQLARLNSLPRRDLQRQLVAARVPCCATHRFDTLVKTISFLKFVNVLQFSAWRETEQPQSG